MTLSILSNPGVHLALRDSSNVIWFERFLTKDTAARLFEHLRNLKFEQPEFNMYGKPVKIPRLQSWMAGPEVSNDKKFKPTKRRGKHGGKSVVDKLGHKQQVERTKEGKKYAALFQRQKQQPWSPLVTKLKSEIEKRLACNFDYVLINKYRNGKDYISYHSDGEACGSANNIIASVSLGSTRKFVLRHKKWKELGIAKHEFWLKNGSMIVMKDDCQRYWKHAIMSTKKIKGERINLTFRVC
eukprot:1387400-Amorphochlora_amoeboformis.AAC.1